MAQVTTGIRSILSHSRVYEFLQGFLGGKRGYRYFVDTYIRPHPGMRILDIGCGPATVLDHLLETVEYVGLDIHEKYVASARKKFGRRATFLCSTIEAAPSDLADFDLVLGMGLLHHLDQEPAEHFFALAAKALKPNGRCLTVDGGLVPGQHLLARLFIALDRGRNIRTAEGYKALAHTAFPVAQQTVRHDLLRLPYTHIIMECWPQEQANP